MAFANFLSWTKDRCCFFQCTDEDSLSSLLESGRQTFYLGIDCTGASLHVGHLVPIMVARFAKKFGHDVIILLGGGTTKIGDPSGKNKSRAILELDQIDRNVVSIKQIVKRLIGDAVFVNNSDWLDHINYLEFLRDVGKHFSINRMLEFESVKTRLEEGSHLSFLEFNYMILQAFDFVELNKRYGCRIQLGGSDQWGNMICGVELGKKLGFGQMFGLTSPLITTASGKKMGKTESGAVWLDANMLSAYEYWQYFRNVEDADVEKFLKLFTELPDLEIDRLARAKGAEINDAKKVLATEATRICHGSAAAENALLAATKEFEQHDASLLPTISIDGAQNITQVLKQINFAKSGSDAKRLVQSGAVRVDGQKILDPSFIPKNGVKISVGKKRAIIACD